MATTIEERVRATIVDQLGVDSGKVKLNSSLVDDLGADSLDIVELVMAMEEEFDLEIPDEEAEKIKSVGDVIKFIQNKTGQS